MPDYPIPAEETRIEMRVANSRFIATIAPTFTVEEAKEFIQRIKAEYSDASHNVPAFLIGYGKSTIAHCNDDGEPSGTAGRPALAVLRGSGLGDAAVVVTRYFGGTKLGTGGLVRAYGDAVREVLAILPRAERVSTYSVQLILPYNLYERVKALADEHAGTILDEQFAAEITLRIQFRVDLLPDFQDALRELSHGSLEAEIFDSANNTVMPLRQE